MKINHIAYACIDIEQTTKMLCNLLDVENVGPVIFDDVQCIYVRLIEPKNGFNIELVSGKIVNSFLSNGTMLYHICLECEDIQNTILRFQENGAFLVMQPTPAKLFNDCKVAFLNTEIGLVEVLESEKKELQYGKEASRVSQGVNIVSNFTIDPIIRFLDYINHQLNNDYFFEYAPYNQVFQTLMDPSSLFNKKNSGYNVVVISMAEWLHSQSREFSNYTDYFEMIVNELMKAIEYVQDENTLIITFCPYQSKQDNVVRKLAVEYEKKIVEAVKHRRNIFCISSSTLNDQICGDYMETYANELAHIPYTDKFYCLLALTIMREIKRIQGYPYKVIVLDCDDTLWNGIAGDDGAKALQLTEEKKKLQSFFLNQMRHGKLLCLCTKNSIETIEEIFQTRNDMPLKKADFVSIKANWNAKYNNLSEIANELGLGLDSFIFVDDSLYECEQMEMLLPEVTTVHLPKCDDITAWLEKQWIFDNHNRSEESKNRTFFMNIEKERKKYRTQVKSLKEFIEGLNLFVNIMPMKNDEVDRVSELSMRTNQFNLSGVRRTSAEFELLVKQGYLVYTIYVTDRYGDYGLVGVIVFEPNTFGVDSFILSCRVLGRGVEHQVIKKIGDILKSNNIQDTYFKIKKTGRNMPAVEFITALVNRKIDTDRIWVSADMLLGFNYEPEEIACNKLMISKENKYAKKNMLAEVQELEKVYENVKKIKEIDKTQQASYEKIKIMYESLLGRNIGDNDDFFECGGNSLLAVQLLNNIYKQFNNQIALREFYVKSSITDMMTYLQHKNGNTRDGNKNQEIIINEKEIKYFPLARAQKALWEMEQTQYKYQNCMPLALELSGCLDVSALQYAINKAVEKHEVFRTVFYADERGVFQTYTKNQGILVEIEDCQKSTKECIDRIVSEEEKVSFKIEEGVLIHAKILVISEKKHILLFNTHHIVFDGWSYGVFFKDISKYYLSYVRKETCLETKNNYRYIDFVEDEGKYLMSGNKEDDLAFWKKKLCDMKYTPLSDEKTEDSGEGKSFSFDMSKDNVLRLNSLSKRHCISGFATCLSIYLVLLSFLTSTEDVAVGTVVSLRDSFAYREVVGLFINTIVIRCKIIEQYTIEQLLEHLWNIVLESLKHKNAYFGDVIEQSGKTIEPGSDNPFYQTMFIYQNELHDELQLEGIETKKYKKGYDIARGPLVMEIHKCEDCVSGIIYYDTHMFNDKFVNEFADKFQQIIEYLGTNSKITVSDLFEFLRRLD